MAIRVTSDITLDGSKAAIVDCGEKDVAVTLNAPPPGVDLFFLMRVGDLTTHALTVNGVAISDPHLRIYLWVDGAWCIHISHDITKLQDEPS